MAGAATYTAPTSSSATALTGVTYNDNTSPVDLATDMTIVDFDSSNKSTLGTAEIFFSLDDGGSNPVVYKCTDAVVNEASIDFDVDGIATIAWSGFAQTLAEDSKPTRTVFEAINSTNNYIRNRLTQLAITAGDVR